MRRRRCRRFVCGGIALVVALIWLLPTTGGLVVAHQAPVAADIGVADYHALLERALNDLRASASNAPAVAEALADIEPISLPEGGTLQPDLTPIVAALTTASPDIDGAIARLEAVLLALDRSSDASTSDADARASLDAVLARDEFTDEPAEDSPSVTERIWGWVLDGLRWLFGPLDRLLDRLGGESDEGGNSTFDAVIGLLGIAFIAGLLFFVIRAIRRSIGPNVVTATTDDPEQTRSSLAARADADRLAAEGNYRAALRARYLATLLRLEEAGRLRFDRALTNREVLVYTVEHGDTRLRDDLAPLVERFDRVWYGGASCTADDYAEFRSLAEHVDRSPIASAARAA